jgi:type VI protein secretion system component VasK
MIGTLLAYVTGWLASKWLSWLGSAAGWVWWAISTTIKGIFSFLQDPRELFAVCVISTVAFGFGAWMMWGFVGWKVKAAEGRLLAVWQESSNKDREDARRAAEARAARAAKEAEERQRQINEDNTKKLPDLSLMDKPAANAAGAAASAHPPVVAGVRDKPAKVRGRKCEQGLFGCL